MAAAGEILELGDIANADEDHLDPPADNEDRAGDPTTERGPLTLDLREVSTPVMKLCCPVH
jgi:hypothetical protein